MGADGLDDPRQATSLLDRLLQAALVQVMAARDAGTGILGQGTGWEDKSPNPISDKAVVLCHPGVSRITTVP